VWVIDIKGPIDWRYRSDYEKIIIHLFQGGKPDIKTSHLTIKKPLLKRKTWVIVDRYGSKVATLKKREDPKQ
jgi:hypothetical protein